MEPLRVLFLCTANSARSQMAEALMRLLSLGRVDAYSAGTHPAEEVHPAARDALRTHYGVDPSGLRPKAIDEFDGQTFDYVITVCDRASESCPVFPGAPERIHWSFEDPAGVTDPQARQRAFETVAQGLAARIRIWLALHVDAD